MKDNVNEIIKTVEIAPNPKHLAIIEMKSGEKQKINWSGLRRYFYYSTITRHEYISLSYVNDLLTVCLSTAQWQGGIIAVWNCTSKRWIHIQEGSYAHCAVVITELESIISYHFISHWGIPPKRPPQD